MDRATDAVPSYPFERTDGGRSLSKRPKQKDDCTVRALALATGADYDTAYDELKRAGRQASRKFRFQDWAKGAVFAGKKFHRISFPARKGERRMNPADFCRRYPEGAYILKTAKHVFAVVDGVVRDASPERDDRCVYGAWEVVPADGTEAGERPPGASRLVLTRGDGIVGTAVHSPKRGGWRFLPNVSGRAPSRKFHESAEAAVPRWAAKAADGRRWET